MHMKRVCIVVLSSEKYLYEIGFSFDVKLISIFLCVSLWCSELYVGVMVCF